MPNVPNQRIGQIAMSYHDYRKRQPKIKIPDIDSVKDMEKILKKLGMKESVNEREMSIKDAYKDLVKDHGSKKALDMLADVLTGGALAAMDDKKVKAFKKKLLKKMMKESVNEVNMAHVYSKDLSKKKFKDLGLYLAHVLDLSPRYDFKLTSNKKLLAINIDKINPKSLQNIKKRFGVDLQQLANESINEISNSEAKTLLKQLGGRKFMMMVGAKGIARDKDGLHMKIGRNSKSISHVVIDYNRGKDLYDMKFLRVRMSKGQMKVKVVKQVKGIYADQLHDTFEKHTGLYTRM